MGRGRRESGKLASSEPIKDIYYSGGRPASMFRPVPREIRARIRSDALVRGEFCRGCARRGFPGSCSCRGRCVSVPPFARRSSRNSSGGPFRPDAYWSGPLCSARHRYVGEPLEHCRAAPAPPGCAHPGNARARRVRREHDPVLPAGRTGRRARADGSPGCTWCRLGNAPTGDPDAEDIVALAAGLEIPPAESNEGESSAHIGDGASSVVVVPAPAESTGGTSTTPPATDPSPTPDPKPSEDGQTEKPVDPPEPETPPPPPPTPTPTPTPAPAPAPDRSRRSRSPPSRRLRRCCPSRPRSTRHRRSPTPCRRSTLIRRHRPRSRTRPRRSHRHTTAELGRRPLPASRCRRATAPTSAAARRTATGSGWPCRTPGSHRLRKTTRRAGDTLRGAYSFLAGQNGGSVAHWSSATGRAAPLGFGRCPPVFATLAVAFFRLTPTSSTSSSYTVRRTPSRSS